MYVHIQGAWVWLSVKMMTEKYKNIPGPLCECFSDIHKYIKYHILYWWNLWSYTETTFNLWPWSDSSSLFLFIQVINGLMEREDWQEAIQTPLGILPGGSGNALAASVHHYSQWVSLLMSHLNAWTNSRQGEQRGTFHSLKRERFISFLCNYAKGWLGTSFLRREERESRLELLRCAAEVISGCR